MGILSDFLGMTSDSDYSGKPISGGRVPHIEKPKIMLSEQAKIILTDDQIKVIPVVEELLSDSFLGGGTAIALTLNHRKSDDWDLFSDRSFTGYYALYQKFVALGMEFDQAHFEKYVNHNLGFYKNEDEIHFRFRSLSSFTVFNYYLSSNWRRDKILFHPNSEVCGIRMPDIHQLALMKVYAMNGRNKWKDAVDLWSIMKATKVSLYDYLKEVNSWFVGIRVNPETVLDLIIEGKWNKKEAVEWLYDAPTDDVIVDELRKEAILLKGKLK